MEWYRETAENPLDSPLLRVNYEKYSPELQDALIELDNYSDKDWVEAGNAKEVHYFKPSDTISDRCTDPNNKSREYMLTEQQKEQFKIFYHEAYDEVMSKVIKSSAFKRAEDEDKAAMLENAREDVRPKAMNELFKWLRQQGAKSTPKKD